MDLGHNMSFFKLHDPSYLSKLDTTKLTLVLPAVSVGNVGQLAVDILITTTHAENMGMIYDESLLPVIGNDPYTNSDTSKKCKLSTCCDVYCAKVDNLLIIQQRGTFVKGKRRLFRQKLITWIKEMKFSNVVMLGSTFAHTRIDNQLSGTQFRYLATDKARPLIPGDKNWIELEDTPDEFGRMGKNLPGSGLSKTLYTDCLAEDIPMMVLLKFCSEGDNAQDALRMAEYANTVLKVVDCTVKSSVEELKQVWKIPKSWNLNFGNTFDKHIY